jgi:histidine triad (HIT) family protein
MATIFTKIISGEIPSYKVAETEKFLAFLDISPLEKGHVLVVPKKEVDYLFSLDEETYRELWLFAQQVAKAVDKAVPCKRVGVAVIGLEVPHAHIHLIPLQTDTINFTKPKMKLPEEEMKSLAEKIKNAWRP